MPDHIGMGCESIREILSATLDAEEAPAERDRAESHLAGCESCQRWWQAATALTRLARTGPTLTAPPVLDSVLDAAPGPGRARLVAALRGLLAAVGATQLGLGLVQITGFGQATFLHVGHPAATDHLWHESAAWNLAVGAAFGWIALRRYRPTGVLPILTVFVISLLVLSANDVLAGNVETGRLVSHALVLTGYLVVLALTRPGLDLGEPPTGPRQATSRWRVQLDADTSGPAAARTAARPLEGTARHRPARHRPAA